MDELNETGPRLVSRYDALSSARAVASLVVSEEPADPSNDNPPSQPAVRTLSGCIDVATTALIEGWVWDPNCPDERIALSLVLDERTLATTVADRDRPELMLAGIGDGQHAFRIDLPTDLAFAPDSRVELRCANSGAPVPGSPVALSPAAAALRWHVDEITEAGVVGWVLDTDEPLRRCVVTLKEANRLHARASAARFRPGLREAGLGDGNCAFHLPLPSALFDGEEHRLIVVEERTGQVLTPHALSWRAAPDEAELDAEIDAAGAASFKPVLPPALETIQFRSKSAHNDSAAEPAATLRTRLLFDISDLVTWIGENSNLTGIQRVQTSIVLALVSGALPADDAALFLTFNTAGRRWEAVPTGFLISVLRDLFLPPRSRSVGLSAEAACAGHLPGAAPLDVRLLEDGTPSVLFTLGASWNKSDHFQRLLDFKRRFATRLVTLVHDLVPIYARETCFEPTAVAFEAFLRRACRHTDHFLVVSQNTARDLTRFIASENLPGAPITVIRNGSSFAEFLPAHKPFDPAGRDEVPARFVLFVSTIEGRKNHRFLIDLWRRMLARGDDPPHLVCVGRLGWRAERFVADLVETQYLNGRIILLQDVSDSHLNRLYDACLFTVYPSLYEGWGLPVGESLAAGKICVCSNRASLPEVAGEFGICIDLDDPDRWYDVIHRLMTDPVARRQHEARIRTQYRPIAWASVAAELAGAAAVSLAKDWPAPYPHPTLPYAMEISFADPGGSAERSRNESVLTRILQTRQGHFLPDTLQSLSFQLGEDARADGAWAEPEEWGTWLCDEAGSLVFGLPPSEDQMYYVYARVRASEPATGVLATVSANAESLWRGKLLGKPQDLMLRVRRRPGAGVWGLTLRIEIDLTSERRRHVKAVDKRAPVVGFERLLVVPESDTRTRIDVVSALQMALMNDR